MSIQIYEKDHCVASVDETSGTLLSVGRLISSGKNVNVSISDDDATFLYDELDLDMAAFRDIKCDAETANNLLRLLFMIESEEVKKSENGNLSERGAMAVNLINLIYDS